MATPLLSICIPTYNRADWLERCLDSCLPQAEAEAPGQVEVVVSDNVSDDGTQALLARYAAAHPLLKVHRNQVNNHAFNFDTAVEQATGRYAWLLGDDDALLPGAVAHVLALIQAEPRDFYLPHVVMDSFDPAGPRLEWFDGLPRLDWDLGDPDQFLEYMGYGRSASAVFSFISVLIFLREPWLAAAAARPAEFSYSGWPHVATALEYLMKGHGRLRVIPEALVNYHCSTVSRGEQPWPRAMVDLRGLTRVADVFFERRPKRYRAFLSNLRKNHGDTWIAHHRISAPDQAAWDESRSLLLKAGFDPLKIAAVDLGEKLLGMKAQAHPGLAVEGLVLADLGFIARGARRILVLSPGEADPALGPFLQALLGHCLGELLLVGPWDLPPAGLPNGSRSRFLPVTLARLAAEVGYQQEMGEVLRAFAPDLLVNLDSARHPGWDLLAAAAGAVAGLAFRAPARAVPAEVAAWLDQPYVRILAEGGIATLAAALGLELEPEVAPPSPAAPSLLFEGPMKLNLGCGQDHLAGWVNVDQFPGSHPDVVHNLEQFPWPFPDHGAQEVLLKHVLEHLGRDSDTFLKIMQELYRICAPDARVRIVVPHPRHQDFLQDPTHVRPVLPELFQHFSLAVNEEWIRLGLPGTPLAKYLELDFHLESSTLQLDPRWDALFRQGQITREQLDQAILERNNVVQSTEIILRAVKPFRFGAVEPAGQGQLLPVAWEGSQFVYHSLAHVNRQLCLGLLASGQVDLSLIPYEDDQFRAADFPAFQPLAARVRQPLPGGPAVHVRHQWPPCFEAPAQGAWVMIQPWEFGGIPAAWVAPMRDQVDEIWVPSTWVKDAYVKSGVPAAQVVVIPNGVDTAVFQPDGAPFALRTKKQCKFLFVGGTIYRKGFDLLLEAYQKSFRATDEVCLVIKAQGGGVYGGGDLAQSLEQLRRLDPHAPEIECLTGNLDEAGIAALYRSCDVLVLPYRGEGFGLPIAEAMASGLPVIVTGRGAAQDFVKEAWAYLIPSAPQTVKQVDQLEPSRAGFWLEEPDLAALGELMKRAYADPAERQAKGRRARSYAVAELGWTKPVALVLARFQALASRVPRRQAAPGPDRTAAPEAFLYEPDWAEAEWAEVLLSFLQAFNPGEPIALVLAWTAGEGSSLEAIQGQVLALIQRSGRETFPDVVLVERPGELPGILAGYAAVQTVPKGRGGVAGLTGAYGDRFATARRELSGGQG